METRTALKCGGAMLAFSLMLLAAAWRVWLHIPHVADLYNVVYDNSRPAKPEDSTTFLFVFPLFCCAGSLSMPISAWRGVPFRGSKLVIPFLVFGIFACGSILRTVTVARYYGV
ncbi:hypothetical protein DC429_02430 [Arthrobacter sp. TPD3018]|uniref:hypothetical protein n=1 Tax=Bacteria TaxID=2 RepID=UPI000D52335A|nr:MULTISPECIES: hypothetical protein [Bacteria]PVE59285.1 hypothetical protein DC425_02430 [Sphingomonas sp. TPD3009]PVE60806.1 hypothetical protein DC429_02430 [Arthrobacter sp. TPD3018]PVE87484.1 hypothetical protein DC431_02425 [Sphingomonas melonis]